MTFLENKIGSLWRRHGHCNKKERGGGVKAVLRLSLGWNGKHPLLACCLMCFHLSLCFYSSWPLQEPLFAIFVSHLLLRSDSSLLPQSKSSLPFFILTLWSSAYSIRRVIFSLIIFPFPFFAQPVKHTSSYLLPLAPLTGEMELILKK